MYGLECRTSRNSTVALTHLQEKLANNLVKKIHTHFDCLENDIGKNHQKFDATTITQKIN